MRVAICDGNKDEREKLRKLLNQYGKDSGQTIEIEEYDTGLSLGLKQEFSFSFVEGKTVLQAGDIIYVETNRHKNLFHTEDGVYSLYKKLDEIEEQLYPFGFVRAHQSYLVNMRYVERIRNYVLYLKDGMEISVPKSRYSYVKERFDLFLSKQEKDSR